MSLLCASCSKIIVLSSTPDHFGICAKCGNEKTKDELKDARNIINMEHGWDLE